MKKKNFLKWWEVSILASIVFAGLAYAQFAYEAITVSNSVVSLTAGTYGTLVKKAFITVEDGPIYFTTDGTIVPTTGTAEAGGVGHLVFPDKGISSQIWLDKYEIQNFKAIKAFSYMTAATIKVSYY